MAGALSWEKALDHDRKEVTEESRSLENRSEEGSAGEVSYSAKNNEAANTGWKNLILVTHLC